MVHSLRHPKKSARAKRAALGFFIAVGLIGYGFGMGVVYSQYQAKSTNSYYSLTKIEQLLKDKFDGKLEQGKLLDGAKAGLVAAAGDPYTVYLTAGEAKELDDDLNGTLSGIGAELGQKDGQLIIVAPLEGSPAQSAGLRPGDEVIAIDGKDTQGLTVDQAVTKIRGTAGSSVKLKLARGLKVFDVTIKRQIIMVPSVKWSMKGGVGYIQVTRFADDTGTKLDQAATELRAKGATKFLLDLRNDPGGYLDAAVQVASQFLPAGKVVVSERHAGKTEKVLKAQAGGKLIGAQLLVMINGGSASASEIVAGALQDQGAAKLVGEKSFGKGSVQDIINLDGGSELKVTIAHWFTPKGRGIDHLGIKPDVEIKQPDNKNSLVDPQLERTLQLFK